MRIKTAPGLAALLLGAFGVACGPAGEGSDPAASAPRLLVVAIDGATWDVMDPLIERGELPNFERLAGQGLRGQLISVSPTSSPVVWTTVATGRFPREHNILDHTYPYLEGDKKPISSALRRVPAVWNIASDAGLRVAVVGYFATHPPEVVNGWMVSDRASQGVAGAVYPAELEAVADGVRQTLEDPAVQRPLLRRFLPWEFDRKAVRRPKDPYHQVSRVVNDRVVRRSVYDEFVRRMTLHLMEQQPDLMMTYFRLVDHVSHAAWWYYDSSAFPEPPDDFSLEMLGDVLPAAYRYLDEVVGDLVAAAGPGANVLILSDHGFGPYPGHGWLTGNHLPNGIFLAAGPDFGRGVIDDLTTVDVTPLLMAALRLPQSRRLAGRLEARALRPGFLDERPIETVDRYDSSWQTLGGALDPTGEAQEEQLQMLKALGYVGGETGLSTAAGGEDVPFWEAEPRLRRRVLQGELVYYLLNGNQQAAHRLLRAVAARDPESLPVLARGVEDEVARLREVFGRQMTDDRALAELVSAAASLGPVAAAGPEALSSR